MNDLQLVADRLGDASHYVDVFGKPASGVSAERHVKTAYRRLSVIVHPDHYEGTDDKKLAGDTFALLGKFKAEADTAAKAGSYGEVTPKVTFTTRRGKYEVVRVAGEADITLTYWVKSVVEGATGQAFCKVAKTSRDNDLLQNEAVVLRRLHGKDADPTGKLFVPELIDSFQYAQPGSSRHQANVITALEGFYNLNQLVTCFPGGLDPRHVVWMWRRLLVAIDHAHQNHIIHGAVLPEHVMVLPEQHGVVLVDWCYASVKDDAGTYHPIKAIVGSKRQWYPQEVLAKQVPGPATDIAMAARCMIQLAGGDPVKGMLPASVPVELRAFFRSCLHANVAVRPGSAWRLLKEFDELLETMGPPYYPRRFLPLVVPSA
jgi:serine/threonine protein kinase